MLVWEGWTWNSLSYTTGENTKCYNHCGKLFYNFLVLYHLCFCLTSLNAFLSVLMIKGHCKIIKTCSYITDTATSKYYVTVCITLCRLSKAVLFCLYLFSHFTHIQDIISHFPHWQVKLAACFLVFRTSCAMMEGTRTGPEASIPRHSRSKKWTATFCTWKRSIIMLHQKRLRQRNTL